MRGVLKWAARLLGAVVLLVLAAVVIGGLWLNGKLSGSLPQLDGEVALSGLSAPVVIERDDLGVPTIRGASRVDVARATGFLHGQERFFQMDLLRRSAAGELAALIGPALVTIDRTHRKHRLRALANSSFSAYDESRRGLMTAYAQGVNAGLESLDAPPPEYLMLRVDPEPWLPQDATLVVRAMYFDLQDSGGRLESNLGVMHDLLPRELVAFLAPPGTEWDAPIEGGLPAIPPIPSATIFDLRGQEDTAAAAAPLTEHVEPVPGSNSWVVAGSHTADGGALLANDMHLGLQLPNIWYRTSLVWSHEGREHRITGVTLPGSAPMIVGSNGHIAWGFTNSYGDYADLVILETDPNDEEIYRTPDGPRAIEHFEERIRVKGMPDEILDVEWTLWGPVIDRDHRGRKRALRWVAHDPAAVNLDLLDMETAWDIDEALDIAARAALPTQNCVVADSSGRIGWTLMGPLARRSGFDGQVPRSWADGTIGWDGYLAPQLYPRVIDPPGGRIWTANNRVVGGELLKRIGNGGFALGSRARQIRDDLMALNRATPRDMLDIQLDDRALFLERWRELLLDTLTADAIKADERRRELREIVENRWTGHASVDSAGYRMVRTFRLFLAQQVFGAITARCKEADARFSFDRLRQQEGPLWMLVTEQPSHLLDPAHENWQEQLLSAVDAVLDRFLDDDDATLARATWGERNMTTIRHPISRAVPLLSRWLDIPAQPLPGDSNMPRVQSSRFGASMRMVVSPGREDEGIFHMPGGQSGHPRSPYYRKGHEAWVTGEPTPFLPGPPVHRLTLRP